MLTTAKLFKTGHSQAVRLPKACRLPGDEVCVHKNEVTGVVTLTPKKHTTTGLDAPLAGQNPPVMATSKSPTLMRV